MRSNNLIEVTSQSYIAFFAILYSSTHATIYLYMSSARLLLPANTMSRARTLYYIGGEPQPNSLIADIRLGLSSYLFSVSLSTKVSHTSARSGATCGRTRTPYIKKLSKYLYENVPSYR